MTGQLVLFLVRHGESGWNAEGRIQGQSPAAPGLTSKGMRQAEVAAKTLGSSASELVIASDLRRAVETAAPIVAALGVPLRLDPLLRERGLGAAEGGATRESPDEFGFDGERVVDLEAHPAGGESLRELYARVAGFLASLRAQQARRIVLVTHGGVVRVARAVLAGQSPEEMSWSDVDNASVHELLL